MVHYDVLIVGGGHGGARVATALRQQNHTGSVAIVSDEPDPPYERPTLSKEYLLGTKEHSGMKMHPDSFWQEQHIDLLLSRRVVTVEPAQRRVLTHLGEEIRFDRLVWAAGGTARRLGCPGHDLRGVHTIRSRADVDRVRAALPATRSVVVIGGGFIGLEVAAILTRLDKKVILLEAQNRLLARVAGESLSRFYQAEHRRHGVAVRLNAGVASIEGRSGNAAAVRLADGGLISADMVIVGIGILPNVEPVLAAGASGGNGVDVDQLCRTTLPNIYAIGDCAAHENAFAGGRRIRLESVQNANDQALTVASSIMGRFGSYNAVPWFWSDQYDLKLQSVGLSIGYDQEIVRGQPADRRFSVLYLRSGKVIALDCVNCVRDYVEGKALITSDVVPNPASLADPRISLKSQCGLPEPSKIPQTP